MMDDGRIDGRWKMDDGRIDVRGMREDGRCGWREDVH